MKRKKKKPQKVNAIVNHLQSNKKSPINEEESDNEHESEDEFDEALSTCSSDEDMVLGEIGVSSDQLSDSESDYYCSNLSKNVHVCTCIQQ